jgi:hypothetical protein
MTFLEKKRVESDAGTVYPDSVSHRLRGVLSYRGIALSFAPNRQIGRPRHSGSSPVCLSAFLASASGAIWKHVHFPDDNIWKRIPVQRLRNCLLSILPASLHAMP